MEYISCIREACTSAALSVKAEKLIFLNYVKIILKLVTFTWDVH
jgi:hypothetical protein